MEFLILTNVGQYRRRPGNVTVQPEGHLHRRGYRHLAASLIEAMGAGRNAASTIDTYLRKNAGKKRNRG